MGLTANLIFFLTTFYRELIFVKENYGTERVYF